MPVLSRGQRFAGAGWRHQRADQDAVLAVPHRLAIAVPVGRNDRQAGRHRLDRRKAERLLDVVDQRGEEIADRPDVGAHLGVAAVEEVAGHRRAEVLGAFLEDLLDVVVAEPADLHEVNLGLGPLLRRLERAIHREGIGLGVVGEPADEQRHDVLGADLEFLAPARARGLHRLGRGVEIGGVDA
jgi:hypothetical protein